MRRNSESQESQAPVNVPEAPEGFKRSGSANAVGWFSMTKLGNVLSGTLIGMFRRPDTLKGPGGESDFFQVKIDRPCEVRAERGSEAKMIEAQAGDVVNVNYGPKTKPWKDYCPEIRRGAVYQVFGTIKGGKVSISGGRKMHDFDVYDKCVRGPQADGTDDADFDGSADETADEAL